MDDSGSREFAAGAAVITDDDNRFAVSSLYDSGGSLSAEHLGQLLAPTDPLLRADGFWRSEPGQRLDLDYVARRIQSFVPLDGSARQRLGRLADLLPQGDPQRSVRALATDADAGLPAALRRAEEGAGVPQEGAVLRAGGPLVGAVVRGGGVAARNDWGGVASLDAELARIPWTSPWTRQAVQLRVQWRLRSPDAASRPRLDAESVAMIDRLNVLQPDPRLYLLRALNAGADRYVLQESLFRYTLMILQGLGTVDDDARRDFAPLQRQFARLEFDDPVWQHHHAEVQSTVSAVAARLAQPN
jgi:hypothetical protein